jgi:anti-sigma factor RsiW
MTLLTHGDKKDSREAEPRAGLCKRLRLRLVESAHRRLGLEAGWVQRHVAGCPRCQRRLAAVAKVDLALSAIRSQPHRLDLLMQANTAAVRMLSHRLRETPQAHRLEQARPEPCLLERCARHRGTVTNVAACIAILFLTKAGIFSSLDKARTRGQAVMKQYYTNQAGEDLAREVFNS